MKKLIFFGLCFFFLLAYGCNGVIESAESSTPATAQSTAESSALAEISETESEQSTESVEGSAQGTAESDSAQESSAESAPTDPPQESETASRGESSEENSGEASNEPSSESSEESSKEESFEESSNIPESSSEYIPEESSEESSEYIPDESSEYIPDESSEFIDDASSETPPDESEDEQVKGIGDAELLPSGYILYNGAAYHSTQYHADVAQKYADTFARYAEIFPNTRISVVTPPQSAINITNPAVAAMTNDQGIILDQMESHIYGGVNFVNLRKIFEEHRGEYMFFKSDFHWTQLGAYYAYSAFAESIGVTPTPLSNFEKTVVTDSFIGRANETSGDDRVLSFVDTIYAYMPTKRHTMTVYNSDLTVNRVFDNCIYLSRKSYSCFITGDQPYTLINVPENDQNKTVIVIKESSGNAFVPFLTEHYGNIIVIDPRHINIDIRRLVAEQGVDDIIFHATASTSSRSGYNDYYRALIGE